MGTLLGCGNARELMRAISGGLVAPVPTLRLLSGSFLGVSYIGF